jgi:hypothetical protein
MKIFLYIQAAIHAFICLIFLRPPSSSSINEDAFKIEKKFAGKFIPGF